MGMIRARVSDEFEEKLKNVVEDVKSRTPLGAEVNSSTIVRGAVEDFIQKIEDEKNGILEVKFDIENLDNEEIEIISNSLNKIASIEEKKGNKGSLFHQQLCQIVYKAYMKRIK